MRPRGPTRRSDGCGCATSAESVSAATPSGSAICPQQSYSIASHHHSLLFLLHLPRVCAGRADWRYTDAQILYHYTHNREVLEREIREEMELARGNEEGSKPKPVRWTDAS